MKAEWKVTVNDTVSLWGGNKIILELDIGAVGTTYKLSLSNGRYVNFISIKTNI